MARHHSTLRETGRYEERGWRPKAATPPLEALTWRVGFVIEISWKLMR